MGDPVRVLDRSGQRVEGAGIRKALVRPVLVVERLELAQGMQEMTLVPVQRAVQQLSPARRILTTLAAAALAAGGLTAITSTPASATTCLGTARSYNPVDNGNEYVWPRSGFAYATSYCNDINVKPTIAAGGGFNFVPVRTCFYPTTGGSYCNAYRDITVGTWGLAATDVKDGTAFIVEFAWSSQGLVAY
jgi:hypothetical protein